MKLAHTPSRWWLLALGLTATVSLQAGTPAKECTTCSSKNPKAPVLEAVDWKVNAISPVTNPMFFEDPVIRTEIRPIFAYHRIHSSFEAGSGEAELYAVQLRYAITDRLAFIAVQDGYFNVDLDAGVELDGWMDLAAGFKYALFEDAANQFIVTPGFTFHIPTGDDEVFQGRGSGEWNPFVSAEKGFGDLHLIGNIGVRVPNDGDEQSTVLHYSAHVDYHVCNWFIPFVEANGWTVLSEGNNVPFRGEGYDVINFGSSNADGVTQVLVGGGFRSRVLENVDLGVAYEKAVVSPEGLTDDRFTFDVCIRF
ncbi:MAG: hypothetical protein ACOYMN_02535 [Roseimicrobium sp.]